MQLPHITVSSAYRAALLAEYPRLNDRPGYWPLLEYLLYGNWRDEDTDELILSARLCKVIEGKEEAARYRAITLLQDFSGDIAPIQWRDCNIGAEKKARRIESVAWSAHTLAITTAEKRAFLPEDRVWLATGNKYRRADEIAFRRATQAEAIGMMETAGCQVAYDLLCLLNNQTSNRFTSIKCHLGEARDVALKVAADPDQQLRILKSIESQAQPFYRPTDKTSRIFGLNTSILALKREVREVMTQDWFICDLRSAQLAICAKVWELPDLEAYLRAGNKIWPDLCAHMGVTYTAAHKGVLKDALYAILFGAGVARLRKQLAEHFPNGYNALKRLQAHPIIRSLFRARAVQLRKIKKQGYGTDAFGQKYHVQYMQVEGKPYRYDSCRSILAVIAQSYELALLAPVVRMAKEAAEDWSICMWLHDGFAIDVRDKRHKARVTARLQEAVSVEATKYGIFTELDTDLAA